MGLVTRRGGHVTKGEDSKNKKGVGFNDQKGVGSMIRKGRDSNNYLLVDKIF